MPLLVRLGDVPPSRAAPPSSSSSSAPDIFLAWPARVVTMINVR
jgi:hypothetical protein